MVKRRECRGRQAAPRYPAGMPHPESDAADSKPKSRAVVGLLVACLALVLGLAYQAITAARSQAATARQLLTEYTRLAADEFTRRASVEVGYYGLYLLGTELRRMAMAGASKDQFGPASLAANPDAQLRRTAGLARGVHRLGGPDGERGALSGLVGDLPVAASSDPLMVRRLELEGDRRTFVLMKAGADRDVAAGWLAIEFEETVLPEWFEAAIDRGTLLPAVTGRAMASDELYLRVSDPENVTIFTRGAAPGGALLVDREFGDDYGGLFSGYRVTAAIRPAAAERLLAGGLPADRVPMLLALLLVAVALLVAAILQVRRERALIETRSDFIARASHELRTPLTQIRMFAEMLLLDRVPSTADRGRFVGIILRESVRLGQLVENILHFSRGARGREASRAPLDLAPATLEVIADFAPIAEQAGIRIEHRLKESALACVDRDAWRQIVLNLLDNAAKYAPNGRVLVSLGLEADQVRLVVQDEGPGIPEDERERVFNRFYRLLREKKAVPGGTGMGLAVVRDLLRQHRGGCSVEAASGGGACFVVVLPRGPMPESGPP